MRVAINGFGRIGRMTARLLSAAPDLELIAVNDLADVRTMSHLFKYDSVHGGFNGRVEVDGNDMVINGDLVRFFNEKDPTELPWSELEIDVVIDCTGKFKSRELASRHLKAGAQKVVISAPSTSDDVPMLVLGVNDHLLNSTEKIWSNASCTTNSAAPMIALLNELCDIESCYITTVHSFTGDQRLHDAPHPDLRRARAATQSIVPTTTGAAKALTRVFPALSDKMGGCGIRVPVPDGSLTDITCIVNSPIPAEELNRAFKEASQSRYKGILEYTEDPVVSIDIIGNTHSCIIDAQLTSVIGNMVKLVGWYDNEIGYSNRLVDLLRRLASL